MHCYKVVGNLLFVSKICVANTKPCFILQDYDQFDLANEVDTLEQFLKIEVPPEETPQEENKVNRIAH